MATGFQTVHRDDERVLVFDVYIDSAHRARIPIEAGAASVFARYDARLCADFSMKRLRDEVADLIGAMGLDVEVLWFGDHRWAPFDGFKQ